jgi:hypothetical protein
MGKLVVVGGHSRNIGKTSVMAEIIRHSSDLNWIAMKITQYGHGVCSINGKSCHCSTDEHQYAVLEEKNSESRTDSSRFLAAGARKSFWIRTKQGMLFEALPPIKKIISDAPYAIMESNSILRFLKPDLYVVVLDPSVADFKASSRQFLDRADVYVRIEGDVPYQWSGISERMLAQKTTFPVKRGEYFSDSLMQFIQEKIVDGFLSSTQKSASRSNDRSTD